MQDTNIGSVQQFWTDCKTTAAKIEQAIASGNPSYSHHPKPRRAPVDELTGEPGVPVADGCYITGLQNRMARTTGFSTTADGRRVSPVCLASTQLAGQRIIEQTHRLSTPAEVEEYKQLQADNRSDALANDRKGKGTMEIRLPDAPKDAK